MPYAAFKHSGAVGCGCAAAVLYSGSPTWVPRGSLGRHSQASNRSLRRCQALMSSDGGETIYRLRGERDPSDGCPLGTGRGKEQVGGGTTSTVVRPRAEAVLRCWRLGFATG